MKRLFALVTVLLLCSAMATAQENFNTAQKPPKQKEVVLSRNNRTRNGYDSFQYAYNAALREAQQAYSGKTVGIRSLTKGEPTFNSTGDVVYYYNYTVVELPDAVMQKIYEAIGKATREIDEGNRFAIDRLNILDGQTDRQLAKSNIVDYLIGRGYKVVAKEHLQKLKEEIDGQGSGLYNPGTTVKSNNFSAVGYFLSVRVDYSYVQVEVVNVSTGEYEGNVTENL